MSSIVRIASALLIGLCASCSLPHAPAASRQMPRDSWSDVPLDSDLSDHARPLAEDRIVPLSDSGREKAIRLLESRKFVRLTPAQAGQLVGHPLPSGRGFTPILVRAVKSNDLGHFRAARGPGYLVVGYDHLGPDRPQRWPLIILWEKNAPLSRIYVDESGGM